MFKSLIGGAKKMNKLGGAVTDARAIKEKDVMHFSGKVVKSQTSKRFKKLFK